MSSSSNINNNNNNTSGRERRDWTSRPVRRDRPYRSHSSSPPRRDDRPRYRDRDREGYCSPRHTSRSRTRSRSLSPAGRHRSPPHGAPPSRELIMEGLPGDLKEDDIRTELEHYYDARTLEDVRVIRDRKTGLSRQFGFLRFADVREASAFLKKNRGIIYLYGDGNSTSSERGAKVKIAFSRERDDRDRNHDTDWKCPNCAVLNFSRRTECLRCHLPKQDASIRGSNLPDKQQPFTNTGDSDAATDSTPSQFLLIRSLEPGVSEEVLAKGIAKLYKASEDGADGSSKKAASKVVSTTSMTNLGAQPDSLKRVFLVRDRRTDDSWRYGFAEFHNVEDAQAALGKYNASDKFTISSKPVLISYIHAGVFVPILTPSAATDQYSFVATANPALKLAYWDEGAYACELAISEAPPDVPIPTMQPGVDAAGVAERSGSTKSSKEASKTKKRKADAAVPDSNKKATPSHLQFWRDRHAELHGIEGTTEGTDDNEPRESPVHGDDGSPPTRSFADLNRMCCYLCSRQFKSVAEVNKHERLSKLHSDNMKNEELKTKALAKLHASGQQASAEASEYRDRAKERRAAYNQPKKPTVPKAATQKPSVVSTEDSKPPAPSKGASLLGKMGWSEGEGLGAMGTGIAVPIATDAYVQGVGLGAQGGKIGDAVDEATRNTKGGYDAFLERTKEKAKERFERMG